MASPRPPPSRTGGPDVGDSFKRQRLQKRLELAEQKRRQQMHEGSGISFPGLSPHNCLMSVASSPGPSSRSRVSAPPSPAPAPSTGSSASSSIPKSPAKTKSVSMSSPSGHAVQVIGAAPQVIQTVVSSTSSLSSGKPQLSVSVAATTPTVQSPLRSAVNSIVVESAASPDNEGPLSPMSLTFGSEKSNSPEVSGNRSSNKASNSTIETDGDETNPPLTQSRSEDKESISQMVSPATMATNEGEISDKVRPESLTPKFEEIKEPRADGLMESYGSEKSYKSQNIAPMFDPELEEKQKSEPASQEKVVDPLGGLSLEQFVNRPCPLGQRICCRIMRSKDSMGKALYPHYELYLEDGKQFTFLMAARKRKKSKSSNYLIETVKVSTKVKEHIVGKVRSNFIGTNFVLYDNGYNPFKEKIKGKAANLRRELGAVFYDANILGLKGPRKMNVIIPRMMKEGEPVAISPTSESDTLLEMQKKGDLKDILVLQNKQPQWNPDTQSYVLNFNGRVTMASVKNFQIVHENDIDYVLLQFGRINEATFTLDMQYPITPLQAFSIALTSFDAKLACE